MPEIAIKYCGITLESDAKAAIAAGANALGFNGFPRSKRFLDLAAAAPWIRRLPGFCTRVAVLVNPTEDEAVAAMRLGCFDRLQLHGDETPDFCARLRDRGYQVIKALPLATEADLARIAEFPVDDVLLDAHAPGVYGGTGQVIDWSLARQAAERFPGKRVILSGGLKPENVAAAVSAVRPYAVDVASGIESAPGRKDEGKMVAFTRNLRSVSA
jgi:phosphoribosylanthranilate isomerase